MRFCSPCETACCTGSITERRGSLWPRHRPSAKAGQPGRDDRTGKAHHPYVEYTMNTPVKDTYAKYPHFSAWWNRVSERPSWRKVAGRA